LRWRRIYACGDPVIDAEHRYLFQISNRILDATAHDEDLACIIPLMDELLAEVIQHFAHEEGILESHRYPFLTEHSQMHRQLEAQAVDLAGRIKRQEATTGALLGFLIQDVVGHHMLEEDSKYLPWVQKSAQPTLPHQHIVHLQEKAIVG
jgi:hemerythrin